MNAVLCSPRAGSKGPSGATDVTFDPDVLFAWDQTNRPPEKAAAWEQRWLSSRRVIPLTSHMLSVLLAAIHTAFGPFNSKMCHRRCEVPPGLKNRPLSLS